MFLEVYLSNVKKFENEFDKLKEFSNIERIDDRLVELMNKFEHEGWNDITAVQEYNKLMTQKHSWIKLQTEIFDLRAMIELSIEENDETFMEEIIYRDAMIDNEINTRKLKMMFNGKYDSNNAILSIHAGSGGKEAQDWASMLMRMYERWANQNSYKCNLIDLGEGEFPGSVKTCVMEISGENAFGMLKNESGVHRLVRVSPFDSQGRRHTSFAAIEVIPEVEMDTEINIDMKDIQMDVFRASGAGGQHVNKTSSAVRLTHIPTGIVVECQQERSQHQNKDYALKVLASKLIAIKEREHYDEISQIKGEQAKIEWGSQIRSYVFMPYQMVKDHRTGHETGNIDAVMNGDLNDFIFKCLAE